MELPDLEVANELKADMSNFESMWGLYEEFNNGLQELAKEDWISFRFAIDPPYLNSSQKEGKWNSQMQRLFFFSPLIQFCQNDLINCLFDIKQFINVEAFNIFKGKENYVVLIHKQYEVVF